MDLTQDLDVFGRKTAAEVVKRLRDNNVAWTPDGVKSPSYLTWDGNLVDGWMMIEMLKNDIRSITGIPASLEQEGGDVPSGTALSQMMIFLWAGTKQLHRQVRSAYQAVAGHFVWGNAFEAAIMSASAGTPVGPGSSAAMGPGAGRPSLMAGPPAAGGDPNA